MANLCVVGLWHQGSVISACLADMGHQVIGVDQDEPTVAGLNAGELPVYEPELKAILRRNLRSGRLRYTTSYREALAGAEFAYITIDTPVGPDDDSDLAPIFEAACQIAQAISGKLVLVIGAQVPVGTCERIADVVRQENPAAVFDVSYVPEFLNLGTAVRTFRRADRFVVGATDTAIAQQVAGLFQPLGRPIAITNLRTAEMAKHASNAFLATSISFINETADICQEVGADVLQVAQVMRLDRRIGKRAFLAPGLGFAGGTLGREIRVLQELGRQHHCETPLMDAVMEVNQARARLVSRRLQGVYDSLRGLQIGVWGLTYKPGTSTLRRSISLEIIRDLVNQGASIKAFDPLARLNEVSNLPPFDVCPNAYAVAEGSDALVLVTEWSGIREVDLPQVRAAMKRPVFVDARNLFDPTEMGDMGFIYSGIGRGAVANTQVDSNQRGHR